MKRIIFLLLILLPGLLCAQKDTGINFIHGLSWDQIKLKAKKENKYIFMDCYATWCVPCKWMKAHIFSEKEVNEYMNAHFINVEVQMDRTHADSKETKKWYADVATIQKIVSIGVYPTYLFFSPEGIPIHRIIGTTKDGNQFISKAANALNPATQYYTLIQNYKKHHGDSLFLRNALNVALSESDKVNALAIGDAYIDCIRNPYAKENITLIKQIVKSTKDKGFNFFLNNIKEVNEALGEKNYAEIKLSSIVADEEVTHLFDKENSNIDWNKLEARLVDKFPMLKNQLVRIAKRKFEEGIIKREINPLYEEGSDSANWSNISRKIANTYIGYNADTLIAERRFKYYAFKKQRTEYENALLSYITKFGDQLSDDKMNDLAWYFVFLLSSDSKLLEAALSLSKHTIANYPNVPYYYVDTYANLLYKAGDREQGIEWEKKVLEIVKTLNNHSNLQKQFELTLDKMQKGEKTWKD